MSHTPRTMLFGAHAYVVGLVPSVRGKAQFCDGGHKLGVARCRRLIRDQPWTWASGHSAATILGRGLAAFTGRRIKDEFTVIRDQAFGRIEAIKGHCRYPPTGCDVQTGYASASACGPLRRSRHLIQSVT